MAKLLFVFSIIGFVATSPTIKSEENLKIVGGEDIEITDAPYQVSLVRGGRHSCGGTIIDNNIIVTAAHCLMSPDPSQYSVRVGSSSSYDGGEIYPVADLVKHPGFTFLKMDSDIALIWLSKPLEYSERVSPVDMIEYEDEVDDGEITIITGWGNIRESGGSPKTLQRVLVPKVNDEQCSKSYAPHYSITPRMICAGVPEGGKDACQGDSGGPMVHDGRLVGVVSWGLGCGRPEYPGVYSKVSALRPWLDEHIAYLKLKHVFRAFP